MVKAVYARAVPPARHDSMDIASHGQASHGQDIASHGQAGFHGPVAVDDSAMAKHSMASTVPNGRWVCSEPALFFAMQDVVQASSCTTLYSRSTSVTGI